MPDGTNSLTLGYDKRFHVRVAVVNAGSAPIQPGEMKSVEFLATLPPAFPLKTTDLPVTVEESTPHAQAPTQTPAMAIRPTGSRPTMPIRFQPLN